MTSLKMRAPLLAVRQRLLRESGLRTMEAQNQILWSQEARYGGYFSTASSALLLAEQLKTSQEQVLVEEAILLKEQGDIHLALQKIEPVELMQNDLDKIIGISTLSPLERQQLSKRLLLATNWMHESRLKQGPEIIDRYKAVIELQDKWEDGYFYLAKYYDFLLSKLAAGKISVPEQGESTYACQVVSNYAKALRYGTKHIFQALPRLLTIWFEFGERAEHATNTETKARSQKQSRGSSTPSTSRGQRAQEDAVKVLTNSLNTEIRRARELVPMYQWLTALPQLISRICHPNEHVRKILVSTLVNIVTSFPRHALWAVVGICKSEVEARKQIAADIVMKATKQLQLKTGSAQKYDAMALAAAQKLFQELIDLAKERIERIPRNKTIPVKISSRAFQECRLLVPRQATLTVALPLGSIALEDTHNPFPSDQDIIERFGSTAVVMSSKERPKKVHVQCTRNKTYNFLCKRESNGDLRKDSRMMEFNTVVNRLLQRDPEGRRRKLRLKYVLFLSASFACFCPNLNCFVSGCKRIL
jgi:serine/threonine-protein kinase ATR